MCATANTCNTSSNVPSSFFMKPLIVKDPALSVALLHPIVMFKYILNSLGLFH